MKDNPMFVSFIGASIVAVLVIAREIWAGFRAAKHETAVMKAKETRQDAEKIVAQKTDDQLIDDFNARYKPDGSSGGSGEKN